MYAITANPIEIVRDGCTFKFDYCEPSKQAKEVAQRELRETPENVENGLRELRRLLQEEPNLHGPLDNDIWLLSFLRPAHFYPEGARNMMRSYFKFRSEYPHLYENLSLDTVRDPLHKFNGSILPQRDQGGRRTLVALSGKYWDTAKYSTTILTQSFMVQAEYVRAESDTQICGVNVILDLLDLSLRQSLLLTPAYLKCLVDVIQDGIGIRLRAYHVVNQPKIFNMLLAVAKPFFREKYAKRLFVHGKDMTSLHRHIAPEYLPECYGGTSANTKASYGPEFYELMAKYKMEHDRSLTYGYIKKN